jgi:hypothetical protein
MMSGGLRGDTFGSRTFRGSMPVTVRVFVATVIPVIAVGIELFTTTGACLDFQMVIPSHVHRVLILQFLHPLTMVLSLFLFGHTSSSGLAIAGVIDALDDSVIPILTALITLRCFEVGGHEAVFS